MIHEIDRQETLEERWLHEKLHLLRQECERQCEPYRQRLAQIHQMRMPVRFITDPSLIDLDSGVRIGGAAL